MLLAWRDHWFAPGPLVNLAVARVILAVIVLTLNDPLRFLFLGSVPPDLWVPAPFVDWIGLPRPNGELVGWVLLASRMTLALVALGVLTPVALAVALCLQLALEGWLNSLGKVAHATIPLLYAMLFLALSPCGAALSIDRLFAVRWARARGRVPRDTSTSVYARWPLELVYAELAAFYFLAGLAKVRQSGFAWADGWTLQFYLLEKQAPAGLWLAQDVGLCRILSGLVLAFELTFPLGMVVRHVRPVYLIGGLLFHLGTRVFLRVGFWPVAALYALFLPWSRIGAACSRFAQFVRSGPSAPRRGRS
jgi:HTTM domain